MNHHNHMTSFTRHRYIIRDSLGRIIGAINIVCGPQLALRSAKVEKYMQCKYAAYGHANKILIEYTETLSNFPEPIKDTYIAYYE